MSDKITIKHKPAPIESVTITLTLEEFLKAYYAMDAYYPRASTTMKLWDSFMEEVDRARTIV